MGLQGLAKQCVDRESLPRTSLRSRRVFIDGDSYVWRRSRRVIDSRGLNDFPEYMSIVKAEATAWRAEGLAVVMYFDGNSGEKKFVTSCKRVARQLRATSSTEEIPYLAKDTVNKQTVPIMLYKRLTRMALRREGIAVKQCWGEADQELCVDATAQQAVVAGDDSDLLVLADELVFLADFQPKRIPYMSCISRSKVANDLNVPVSHLPMVAAMCPNDFLPEWVLTEIRVEVLQRGESEIARVLSEMWGEHGTMEAVVDALADAASQRYAARCANTEGAAVSMRAHFRQKLALTAASFANPATTPPPRGEAFLPAALVASFGAGLIGPETAFLSRADEPRRLWKYPVMPELHASPPVHSHFRPIRQQVYRLFMRTARLDSYTVTEQTRDSSAALLLEEVVVSDVGHRGPLPTLEHFWGAGPCQDNEGTLAYFLSPLASSGVLSRVVDDSILCISFLMAQGGVCKLWELAAFHAAVRACVLDGDEVVVTLLRTSKPERTPTERFSHVESLFFAALHTLLICSEVSQCALFSSETFSLEKVLVSFNSRVAVTIYNAMLSSYDKPKYAGISNDTAHDPHAAFITANEQGSAGDVFSGSPFNRPAGVAALLLSMGVQSDAKAAYATQVERAHSNLLTCLEETGHGTVAPEPKEVPYRLGALELTAGRSVADVFPGSPVLFVSATVKGLARCTVALPEGTVLLSHARHAVALCSALQAGGRDFVNLHTTKQVVFNPAELEGYMQRSTILLLPYDRWCDCMRSFPPGSEGGEARQVALFLIPTTVEYQTFVPRARSRYTFALSGTRQEAFFPIIVEGDVATTETDTSSFVVE